MGKKTWEEDVGGRHGGCKYGGKIWQAHQGSKVDRGLE
jgi:hypothetical protein